MYIPLIVGSMTLNYIFGQAIRLCAQERRRAAKMIMVSGLTLNLGLLGYFKYTNFFLENLNKALGISFEHINIILPLAISFFTFQQIAYLVDCYQRKVGRETFLNYSLFVTFFPQLIAGPIVHHREMIPQFSEKFRSKVNWDNIAAGLFIFTIGLFKKVIIADNLAEFASWGFDDATFLTFTESVMVTLSYTFQIYFDFCGYSDMAIGAALFFNIKLPSNFNSPYKAMNIRDFWQRWHITLSHFLRDYLYIPLGGNKNGLAIQFMAVLITFLLGGLWHGASWTFIVWGMLHGLAIISFTLWEKTSLRLPYFVAWATTFVFINITWIVFRASDWDAAKKIFKGLGNVTELHIREGTPLDAPYILGFSLLMLVVFCKKLPNSNELLETLKTKWFWLIFIAMLGMISFWKIGDYSEFLYFQF